MNTYPLCIIAPFIGAVTETFIMRHMNELLPGRTVVITTSLLPRDQVYWQVNGPVLSLGYFSGPRIRSLLDFLVNNLGRQDLDFVSVLAARFLRKHGVRVIYSEYLDNSLQWLPVAKRLGLRFFAQAFGYDVSQKLQESYWRERYLELNQADAVLVPTALIKEKLIQIGILPPKVFVVPYGVDVPAKLVKSRKEHRISIVSVGRMVPKKAPMLMLDAFRKARDIEPNLMLNYYGDGELMPEARRFVDMFDLGEHVIFHGFKPFEDVAEGISEADIYIQHSVTDPQTGNTEGLPVAILNAMALGLPVVSTRHAGIPAAVIDGVTGYLVEEGDVQGMTEKIIDLASSAEKRDEMGRAGWMRAKSKFSWEREKAKLLEIFSLPV